MSVIASSISGISSILKSYPVANKSIDHHVRFRLPRNIKQVLLDFKCGNNIKQYQELIFAVKDVENLEDNELLRLLKEIQEYISELDKKLHHFVEALLNVNWADRNNEIVKEFQGFFLDLLSAHNYYTKHALDNLMTIFKTGESDEEWMDGIITDQDQIIFSHVHDLLKVVLQVIPMSCDILMKAVAKCFPYHGRPAYEQECFIHNMLRIAEYQPQLRTDIIFIIFKRLVAMDVNAPRSEVLDNEGECENMDIEDADIFDMDNCGENKDPTKSHFKMKHPVANSLDVAMRQMFLYINSECYDKDDQINWEKTKKLYQDFITVFDQVVLTTHATYHVQFLMFYICSFKMALVEAFLMFLWRKVVNPNVAPIIRQSAVMYIGSLLSRASYINISKLKASISEMCTWIHKYITSQDGLECANSDVRVHAVFYSVCQSLFYVIAFRHRDFVGSRKNLTFLQSLNLTKIVTCKLNPLKVCLPVVVQNFAAITRTYQLAYCYSVIEHNSRYTLPVIHQDKKGYYTKESCWLEIFFPFDPFILKRCSHLIEPLYCIYQKPEQENQVTVTRKEEGLEEEDEDDFLSDISTLSEKFSYSSSPGFKRL